MTDILTLSLERRRASNLARDLAIGTAREFRSDAQRALWLIVAGLADLVEVPGVDPAFIEDTCNGLLDQASNVTGTLSTNVDEAGGYYPLAIDVEAVKELLRKVSAPKTAPV